MTTDSIVGDIVSRLDAKKTAAGWMARCPAHDDNRASLSISQGSDGKILFRCHAGCDFGAITSALGLDAADCFPADETMPTPRPVARKTRLYPTLEKAIEACLRGGNTAAGLWEYHDENGTAVGAVVRFHDAAGKKGYRPFTVDPDGWRMLAMPTPRPLFRLPAIVQSDAKILVVVEGEKCADAAWQLGFTATTSAGGANAAGQTDWKPASAFNEVWILPDNDAPGLAYADEVERQIKSHDPACRVKVVGLPGVGVGGDLIDWMNGHGDAAELPTMRQSLERLANEVGHEEKPEDEADGIPWEPFPVDHLPSVMRRFVEAGAASIGCDASYLALPILAVAGAAIGSSRVIQPKPDWNVPPILWVALVGRSSAQKSPAFNTCISLINDPQRRWRDEYGFAIERHNAAVMHHEKSMAQWRKSDAGEPPSEPQKPACRRLVVADCTQEALAGILADNPRGLLLARDELAGWFGSFTRYSANSDAPFWLSLYNGTAHTVDRRGRQEPLFLDRPLVGVVGGIQDKILRRHLAGENLENGIAARLLVCAPPATPRRWRDSVMPAPVRQDMADTVAGLLAMPGRPDGSPETLVLSPEAEELFKGWYDENGAGMDQTDDDAMAAALGKIEELPARLAVILHSVTEPKSTMVAAATMANAIGLTRWFRHEATRWYEGFGVPTDEANNRKLLAIIRQAGSITVREAQRRCRWLKGSGLAEKALEQLHKAKVLKCNLIANPKGGRPVAVYSPA